MAFSYLEVQRFSPPAGQKKTAVQIEIETFGNEFHKVNSDFQYIPTLINFHFNPILSALDQPPPEIDPPDVLGPSRHRHPKGKQQGNIDVII